MRATSLQRELKDHLQFKLFQIMQAQSPDCHSPRKIQLCNLMLARPLAIHVMAFYFSHVLHHFQTLLVAGTDQVVEELAARQGLPAQCDQVAVFFSSFMYASPSIHSMHAFGIHAISGERCPPLMHTSPFRGSSTRRCDLSQPSCSACGAVDD